MATLSSGIRDNHQRGSVGDFLREKIRSDASLSFVSAYFTIYAFESLKPHLQNINHLDFLFGEPRFIRTLDPDKTDKKFFKIVDEKLELAKRLYQKQLAKECADWIRSKVDIRSVKQTNLLHGKMYHIRCDGVDDAIVGSSNFTVKGLGLGANSNIELNLEVNDRRDRADLKNWFEELWNDSELVGDVKEDVLLYLEQLYQNNSPEFIYYKTLYHIFEKFLTDQDRESLLAEQSQLVDTVVWSMLYEFQKDGVKGAINKILSYGGCIIADSVGLGKTFEALAVIKYFELRNHRVLVLCPKKLRENWTNYLAQNNSELNPLLNDRFSYTVLSHTDLNRDSGFSGDINLESINWGNYDFVVIDESHNFRNNTPGKKDEDGNLISKSRYQRLMEDIIQSGVKTKVLLLSATPVNNTLQDLRNQFYFITENRDDAFDGDLGIISLRDTLAAAQRIFTRWSEKREGRTTKGLLDQLSSAFFKLLDQLTIARSRKHIKKYYRDSIEKIGRFPKRLKPISISPTIDRKDRFPSYDKLNGEISNYQLSLFNPSNYVMDQFKGVYVDKDYPHFKQTDREHFLIAMMRVNFLKRLESSVYSFTLTMQRTIDKIEALETIIEKFEKFKADNPEVLLDDPDDIDPEDEDLIPSAFVGKKLKFSLEHIDVNQWKADLQRDKQQLHTLYLVAKDVTPDRDAKLGELKKLIEQRVKNPSLTKSGEKNHKILIFTAFSDTAEYLYQSLKEWIRNEINHHVAMVSGGSAMNKTTFGKSDFNHILTNFSPISKNRNKMPSMQQDDEIDILIATDCISEGQNLQDCDFLVNYDIHWNPVRIIQRFGRIDRIGSINETIQMVNFWPTDNLDNYIRLKTRVEARMALVDITATGEDNLLDRVKDIVEDELTYRDKQLLRLREEVLDLEDFDENISLTDFTLDDFRAELMRYIETNRKQLDESPLGLYAVVPAYRDYSMIRPGVIFCLKQKGQSDGNEKVNPVQPYFLVYIYEKDLAVRYNFAQPKQILEIMRLICADKKVPYENLCNLFDQQTCNAQDMDGCNSLLNAAIRAIAGSFKKRTAGQLISSRNGVLPDRKQQVRSSDDFELITWVVIK
jgi:SNF2 family DNA or RNA helicase